MAPLEPWEKVLVDGELFTETVHGQVACTDCHAGVQTALKDDAHDGLIVHPSDDSENACGSCHPDVLAAYPSSLHTTQQGYWTTINARSNPEDPNSDALQEMFGNHCGSCHTTCGDCHVSQPKTVGGGFIDGHIFNATPSMTRNCTACHGSRVGNEYLGKHEDLRADVHFRKGRMTCMDCHNSHELHGQEESCDTCHISSEVENLSMPEHRYEGVQLPSCEACHTPAATGLDGLEMHQVHGGDLSCQVCHSLAYTSCDGCHVAVSESTGNPYFETEASYLTFLIGRNPIPSYERPYDFIPVRHVPISQTSYQYYGENLLVNFDELPTWVYATPHNIQTETPQAESCNSCHGNPDLFLTEDKVTEGEIEANLNVIVDTIPIEVEEPPGEQSSVQQP